MSYSLLISAAPRISSRGTYPALLIFSRQRYKVALSLRWAKYPEAGNYSTTIDSAPIAELDEVLAGLKNPAVAVWDARSPEEYRGEKVVAARGGHIPGAINIDWLELIDRDNDMRLIDLDGLQQRLNSLGLSRDKTIITHCHTHHRSGLTYLAMKILGYPSIKGYHGSWSEWGNRNDTPIEQ